MEDKKERTYFMQQSELDIDERFGAAWEVRYYVGKKNTGSLFFASCGYMEFGKENAEMVVAALDCLSKKRVTKKHK